MSLAETSIKRPVLATVMSLAILLFGITGFTFLGVREYPAVDPPIVTVQSVGVPIVSIASGRGRERTDRSGVGMVLLESMLEVSLTWCQVTVRDGRWRLSY